MRNGKRAYKRETPSQQNNSSSGDHFDRPLKRVKTNESSSNQTLYVLLDDAPLEVAQVGREYVLLSSDLHANFLRKHHRDPFIYRPDIVHHCLLNLMDSPLNKAGLLKVFIKTTNGVLIDIHPQCKIPRTYRRFAGLMAQLLHRLKIRSTENGTTLLRTIPNPITQHLPDRCPIIGLEVSEHPKRLWEIVPQLHQRDQFLALPKPNSQSKEIPSSPICFVIGAFAHGEIGNQNSNPNRQHDYQIDQHIAISYYGLSAGVVASKLCTAYEEYWGVL